MATGKETSKLEGHTDPVMSVAICPDGKTIVSGSNDKTIRCGWEGSWKLLPRRCLIIPTTFSPLV